MLAARSWDFEAVFGRFPTDVERLALNGARSPARHPLTTPARFRDADRIVANDKVVMSPGGKNWALSTSKLLTDLYVIKGLR